MSNLLIDNEKLASTISSNNKIKYTLLTLGSSVKLLWQCKKNHTYETSVKSRNSGRGCPYCSGNKILPGFNDFITLYPHLLKEWDNVKNGSTNPKKINKTSTLKVWWICNNGHSWRAGVANRTIRNSGCIYCTGSAVLEGFNDLTITNNELLEEWHENNQCKPTEYSSGSKKKVWWKCFHGHEWEATVLSRTSGAGCPYCNNRLTIAGKTDLLALYPEIAKDWSNEKNENRTPENFLPNSHARINWKCEEGHEIFTTITNRRAVEGCVICKGTYSRLEKIVFEFLSCKYDGKIIHNKRFSIDDKKKLELDFFLPDLQLAFEVQDFTTHSKVRDNEPIIAFSKNLIAYKNGPVYHERKRKLAKERLNTLLVDLWENEIKNESYKEKIIQFLSLKEVI